MEKLKIWAIEVGVKKLGPSAIRAAVAGLVGLLVAHANLLEQFGIVYDSTLKTVTLHLDSLTTWLTVTGLGLITATLRAAQHHGEAVIKGAPQSGDLRKTPNIPLEDGDRKTDIKED